MKQSEDSIKKYKDAFEKKKGEPISDGEAEEGLNNLAGFFELMWKFAKEDTIKKNRLKKEPDGFPTEGRYSCRVCGQSIDETNGWYDWYGQTCLMCRKAVKDGTIPTFIFEHHDSYFATWALNSKFNIKHQTMKKMIKEGNLVARIVLTEEGKPHEYIFLKKENPHLIDPDRHSPARKSYDKNYHKRMDKWSKDLKDKLLAEHKERMKKYKLK